MTTTHNVPYEGMARRSLEGPHYRAAVIAMAERKTVFAAEDIYTADGTKWVVAGTRIEGEPGMRLFTQELFKPLDLSLAVEDGVTAASLSDETSRLCLHDDCLRRLSARFRDLTQLHYGLLRRHLPPQMAFKLTVAREQRPRLFRHSLLAALLANFLVRRRESADIDPAGAVIAALLHDLGELYTDPALLMPDRRVSERERRYIYAHPVMGYLLAKEVPGLDESVAIAILQHQERLDGSGYPLGLRAKDIGMLGRIVAVADVSAAILERFGHSGRLPTLMRLNRQKYDAGLIALLQDAFSLHGAIPEPASGTMQAQLAATVELLARWDKFRAALAQECGGSPPQALAFVFERMVSLRVSLLQFGFDPDSLRLLMDVAREDARIAMEMRTALDEMRWQFADLEHEIARRRETIAPVLSDRLNRFLDSWMDELRDYPDSSQAGIAPPAGSLAPDKSLT